MLLWLAALLLGCCSAFVVREEQPHDTGAFTQGLFFHDGKLHESTGLYGSSRLRRYDAARQVELEVDLESPAQFGEGSVVFQGRLFWLTWQARVCYVYEVESFALLHTLEYETEGWGLTHDSRSLIMSDGSSSLFFRNASFHLERQVDTGRSRLNELEYVDSLVYANVWLTHSIVVIEPSDGSLVRTLDFASIDNGVGDVLNGIAFNPADGLLYVTGKQWDTMYLVELEEAECAEYTPGERITECVDIRMLAGLLVSWGACESFVTACPYYRCAFDHMPPYSSLTISDLSLLLIRWGENCGT